MTDAAPAIFVALEQSGFAAAIRQSPWLYPAANVGHIVFLTLFAGAIAVMDVRLLGGLSATGPGPLLARTRNVALAALAERPSAWTQWRRLLSLVSAAS